MDDYRISKLREYLFEIINVLTTNRKYQINADMLGKIGDYSLDRIPTETGVEQWIIPTIVKKEVYSFRSRKAYSQDVLNNLKNIGFFEDFETCIKYNNDNGILPDIINIEKIECLNSGSLIDIDGTEATFEIQIQITYRDSGTSNISL